MVLEPLRSAAADISQQNQHFYRQMHIIYYLWTLSPVGVSVCLSYMIDFRQPTYGTRYLFTLSPSNPLRLVVKSNSQYLLFIEGYTVYLNTDILLLPNIGQTPWTKICLNIDSGKNVVQMFSGRQASIRKILPVPVRCSRLYLFATRLFITCNWTDWFPSLSVFSIPGRANLSLNSRVSTAR